MGGGKLRPNGDTDAFQIAQDIGGAEAQRTEAFARQNRIANRIMGLPGFGPVLFTIDFDDDMIAKRNKIEEIATERRLPSEMMALRSQGAEERP